MDIGTMLLIVIGAVLLIVLIVLLGGGWRWADGDDGGHDGHACRLACPADPGRHLRLVRAGVAITRKFFGKCSSACNSIHNRADLAARMAVPVRAVNN